MKFFGAYGFFYFRLLQSMYEAVWMLHIVFLVVLRVVTTFVGLGEYIGRSLFHYVTNYPPMEAIVTYIFIRVLQLIAKACRQYV